MEGVKRKKMNYFDRSGGKGVDIFRKERRERSKYEEGGSGERADRESGES